MEKEIKERNGCISFWLWIAIIANVALSIFYAVSMFNVYSGEMALGFGLCSIFGVVNVLSAILLLRWNKIGFYMMVVSSIMAIIINVCVLKMEPVTMVGSLFAIVIWWAILQMKKDGVSAWSQLKSGWDGKHCRHLYQLFAGICAVLFVLTLIAFGHEHSNPIVEEDVVSVVDDEIMPKEEVEEVIVVDSVADAEDDVIVIDESPRPEPKEEARKEEPNPTPSKKKAMSEEPLSNSTSKQNAAGQLLKVAIEQANKEFPQDTGMGMVITRVYLSGDYVMYVAECDEDLISMDLLEQNKSSMINEIRKMAGDKSNAEIAQFVKICANAGKGIGYSYIGDTSGKKVTVRLTNQELKKLL